ncbi:pyruvate:ferredoxin (flavodoxin) oxidoreductase, partial [Candidatus Poribacteria bacterium]|nr:pyruvate:ferredoxin (flavodoxin) oxidoreductase [Candidatus Poribacteria bacterium]
EAVSRYYEACPGIIQQTLDDFAKLTGRQYHLFEYHGAPDAERVFVLMGSGAETVHETVDAMNRLGEKVGMVKVRLFMPFDSAAFVKALPSTVRSIAVLDRVKEPGAPAEPLHMAVLTAVSEQLAEGAAPFKTMPVIVGGRYGLGSKEFTPGMVRAVYDNLTAGKPRNHFTIGIVDDVMNTSLSWDEFRIVENDKVFRALFYGLGADGTVGANKNTIKIIGEETASEVQGYFVYDSKKAGSVTVSHLRFGPNKIRSEYLISSANFIGCHQWGFIEKVDMLAQACEGATFLLNSIHGPERVWDMLPLRTQEQIISKKINVYVIDAYAVAAKTGMGQLINTIMQTCFFAISGVLPREEAIARIKDAIKKTYGGKSEELVQRNWRAVDGTLENLHRVHVPGVATSLVPIPPAVSPKAPEYVRNVTAELIAGRGDLLPVSAFPPDGTYPSGTSKWEKRNIALEIPVWDEKICIQCGKCSMVCTHAAILSKTYEPHCLEGAPESFKHAQGRGKGFLDKYFTIQVASEDCTGCGACVHICPAFDKSDRSHQAINMAPQPALRDREAANLEFFMTIPEPDRAEMRLDTVKTAQMLTPLFEFSGACAGCGETPYVKLLSQLFGDRALIANATGCSSIYGGNLPTTPWTKNAEGRGPAWANSLFEDNAEFGLGFRLAVSKLESDALALLRTVAADLPYGLADGLLTAEQNSERGIREQRQRVVELKKDLEKLASPRAVRLLEVADYLVRKSIWIVGGDGWAYDIGWGGLDHVLASGENVNILVLDTEVYSNTGGQASKSTPRGAVAKFATGGKPQAKKDLGLIAMSYGNVYVAKVAYGANDAQTVKAFLEAEAYPGPSLIIAYSHCIAHGINMKTATDLHRDAAASGHRPLLSYNPQLAWEGKNPMSLDSKAPSITFEEYAYKQMRFKMLTKSDAAAAKTLLRSAQEDVKDRWSLYEQMASMHYQAHKAANGSNGSAEPEHAATGAEKG